MTMPALLSRAALCALTATMAACNDSTAPRVTDFDGEWLFTESLVTGPEDGCGGSGSWLMSAVSPTAFTGLIARVVGGCSFKPYGTPVLNGQVSGNAVTFTVGPCTHTGTFVGGGRDSVSGTFTCAPPAPAGTGTWRASRAGVPVSLSLGLTARTMVVGGTVRITANFIDATGRQLYPRNITWRTGDAMVAAVVPDLSPGTSAAVVTAIGTGATGVVAQGHVTDSRGLDQLMGAGVLVNVKTVTFATISAGSAETCGLSNSGEAWCWGSSFGSTTPAGQFAGVRFSTVSSGGFYTCGVLTSGAVQCSGLAVHGNTGVVSGSLTFASVSVGSNHTCGVTTTSEAYCWGDNTGGQLGNGSTLPQALPVAVSGGLSFASVSAGDQTHSCGIATNGAAWCWGFNGNGELGNGSTTGSNVPVSVSGGLTFISLSAGGSTTCGIAAGGGAYCWGRNAEGQLGIGVSDVNAHASPVAVGGGLVFANVSSVFGYACGVTTAHAAWCWGTGSLGGATASSTTPVPVSGGLAFASVSVQDFHSCGLTTGNVAWCWGGNASGALGNGTIVASPAPVQVMGQP